MAVDTSDLNSLDTIAIIEAIENQGTTSIITALTAVTAAVNAITQGAEDLSTDDIVTAITALTAAVNGAQWTYGATDEELYKTDGNGGTDADINDTEKYTSDIDLTVSRGATIIIEFDGSCATDDLIVSLYARQNDSWDGDEVAQSSVTMTNDGSEDIYTLNITPAYGAGHYRIGLLSAGATTTFEIDAEMRRYK